MVVTQCAPLLLLCGVIHCLEPKCGLLCPKRRTAAVPETFAVESFRHEGAFPVQVSLHNNFDKRVNHDSQQLELSTTNPHPRFSNLKIQLEDSPSKDEVNRFVYLEDESNNLIKEETMALTEDRQLTFTQERKPDLKMRKRSKRSIEEEIEELTDNYKTEKVKQCCRDGHEHFKIHKDCFWRLKEMEKEGKPHCYKAFEKCCIHSSNYFTKPASILWSLGFSFSYCVTMPRFWKVAEPQRVKLERPDLYGYFGTKNDHIQIRLLSYPDKNVTYDSQELLIDGMEVAGSLLFKREDLPNGDELEKFVYLVIAFKDHDLEKKVPLLDLRVTQLDLKKRKGSTEGLESEIEILASKYQSRRAKRTCRDGHKHYIENSECQSRLTEFEEEGMLGLYRVFQKCCLHTREYTHRLANTKPEQYNTQCVS